MKIAILLFDELTLLDASGPKRRAQLMVRMHARDAEITTALKR